MHISMLGRSSGSVFEGRIFRLISVVMAFGVAIFLSLYIFFFSEMGGSYAVISWHSAFENALLTKGEVKLQSLVKFPSERVFFLEPYERLDDQLNSQLFPAKSWLAPFLWEGDKRYWTIAYQRENRPPFLIKMKKNEWNLRQQTNLWTVDPEAKLVLIRAGTPEAIYCTRAVAKCLALSDSKSIAGQGNMAGD